jgi:hypothetical protein
MPFQLILQPSAKFVPFAVSVKEPFTADVGDKPVSVTAPAGGGEESAGGAADEVGNTG